MNLFRAIYLDTLEPRLLKEPWKPIAGSMTGLSLLGAGWNYLYDSKILLIVLATTMSAVLICSIILLRLSYKEYASLQNQLRNVESTVYPVEFKSMGLIWRLESINEAPVPHCPACKTYVTIHMTFIGTANIFCPKCQIRLKHSIRAENKVISGIKIPLKDKIT